MSEKKEHKGQTQSDRCKAILVVLEKHRDVLEEAYLVLLEANAGLISREAIEQLDNIQELDEHIAEMKKHHK
jgi:hypothetical protein